MQMNREAKQSVDGILNVRIEKIRRRREWRQLLLECVIVFAVVYLIFQYVIGMAFVSGNSMRPGLEDGELVVFYRLDESYQADDVVIIYMEEEDEDYIKRIVAGPGDVVDFDGDGALTVNGMPEERVVLGDTRAIPEGVSYPYTVSEGCYFVLGDNREHSSDSRSFGEIPQENIRGRVFAHLGTL